MPRARCSHLTSIREVSLFLIDRGLGTKISKIAAFSTWGSSQLGKVEVSN